MMNSLSDRCDPERCAPSAQNTRCDAICIEEALRKERIGHHVAAIEMAEVELAKCKDAESRALATKIIADQKREVAQIDARLRKRGQ